jgi:hypothetical protein
MLFALGGGLAGAALAAGITALLVILCVLERLGRAGQPDRSQ